MSKAHRRAANDMELFPHSAVPDGSRSVKDRRQSAGFYPFLSESDIIFSIVEDTEIYEMSENEIYSITENEIYSVKNIDQIYNIEEIEENYGIVESELYIVEEK